MRGGFGNSLKTIETAEPVQEEIDHAFEEALRQRGLLAGRDAGNDTLGVTIWRVDCSQYVRREARTDFQIVLMDSSGRAIYQNNVQVTVVSGSKLAINVGIFVRSDELRAVAIEAMTKTIDQALDKSGFMAALTGHSSARPRISNDRG